MDDFDERLAEEVRKHRRLYDNACPSRKNSKATTATWRTIGGALGEDPALCMRRWKALRDKFVRLKKRIKAKPPSHGSHGHQQQQQQQPHGSGSGSELPGAEGVVGCHHVIHDKLSWLNDHVTHRSATIKKERSRRPKRSGENHLSHDPGAVTDMDQSSEALPMSEAECDGELDGCKPPATHHGRRKATDNATESAEDAYDRYTQTVADFMRGLSRRRCVVFKKRLNDLMYEMDLEELDDFAPS
ncbi:hypothetical protein CRUP_015917 [Coryphaenoides rupestris]|nr:hypothetical protein CRUP_015917 [Coryphaenoides rupestris]